MSRKLTIVNNRIVVNSIEARAALADFDPATGRWTLYANTQGGWLVKNLIGPLFGTDPEKFRIITPDVGGGFGMKLFLYAEHVLTCYAARKLGRPVKWAAERGEAFLCDTQGRDNLTLGELAIDADGKFLALRTRNVSNMGAYLSTFAPYIPTYAGTGVLSSVYGFKAIYANVLGVFTNTVPVDAYRGAGRPESNYLVERLVDAAARELSIDKVELRRRNMVLPDAMPHATPVGKSYDSGDFRVVLDAATKRMDYAGFAAPQAAAAARGKRRGLGLAYYLEATGGDPTERAEIRFADDGFVDVYVGTQSTGQGHETAYVQLTADQSGHRRREDPHPPGRHRHHPGRRRHRWRAQPVFRGAGDPADLGIGDQERQAGGGGGNGSRGGGHRVRRGPVFHRRHRPRHRHHCVGGDAAEEGRGRSAGDLARRRRNRADRCAYLPQRLPHGGGRGRSGNRRRRTGALQRVRRFRKNGEPADRARPGGRRRGAGLRSGGAGAHRL